MRVTQQADARNRDRVVRTASALFRDQGFDGVGIATLMKTAGLTNGAFYKQFASKEALLAEATADALAQNNATWASVLDGAATDPQAAIEDWYLSDLHLDHRDKGCAYAALAAEAPRHDPALRAAFEAGIQHTVAQIAAAVPGGPDDDPERAALRLLSRMVGALILARATSDPALRDQIVTANQG